MLQTRQNITQKKKLISSTNTIAFLQRGRTIGGKIAQQKAKGNRKRTGRENTRKIGKEPVEKIQGKQVKNQERKQRAQV